MRCSSASPGHIYNTYVASYLRHPMVGFLRWFPTDPSQRVLVQQESLPLHPPLAEQAEPPGTH